MCRRLLLLSAYLFDGLTVSYVPLLDIGNKEEVDSGEADCTDGCDVHDEDIDHENKAPLLSEAVKSVIPIRVKGDWGPAAPTLIELMWGLDDLVCTLWPVFVELLVEELKILAV
jgi:hypothetical protein